MVPEAGVDRTSLWAISPPTGHRRYSPRPNFAWNKVCEPHRFKSPGNWVDFPGNGSGICCKN